MQKLEEEKRRKKVFLEKLKNFTIALGPLHPEARNILILVLGINGETFKESPHVGDILFSVRLLHNDPILTKKIFLSMFKTFLIQFGLLNPEIQEFLKPILELDGELTYEEEHPNTVLFELSNKRKKAFIENLDNFPIIFGKQHPSTNRILKIKSDILKDLL